MDIKFFIVLLCSFNLTLGRDVENKIKKLRGDLGEESDEDEDVVRIQWEGNGNFGKKFNVLSDIDSAESGIPWPILQPPFYYYSSSINDFDRENLNREDQKGLEENSGERNRSDSVKKLRIYEITGPGRRDEKSGENLGNVKYERKDSGKIDLEGWKNRSIGNLGEFDNNDNVRKLNEYFERKDNFERWNFGGGNFGKGSSRNFGNQSEGNSDNFGNGRNLKVLKVGENFERGNFGNDKNWRNLKVDGNLEHRDLGNDQNFKVFKVDENLGSQNFDKGENFKILNSDKHFENDKNMNFDENLERQNFGIDINSKVFNNENFEHRNFGNDQNFKILNGDKHFEHDKNMKFDENLERQNFETGRNVKVFNNNNFENDKNWKNLKVDKNLGDHNFDNDQNFKSLNNDKHFENDKNMKFDENLERTNFGIGRNLKVLKIDEKEMQNFGNKNLKVVKIGENFSPVHVRNFGNTQDNSKAHNVQILSRPRDWFDGVQKSDDRIKNESDFGWVKRPKNFENNREIDDDQNDSEETDGVVKSTTWDPSKIGGNIIKLRPVQSLSVIKPLKGSQFPRGNRKYQNSEEMSERRNWEFSRDGQLRRKEFQRVNHFKYLDSHSKFGAIPGVPGRDYPVNTEYNQRATKKFICPTHIDTHIYIADRSSRCQVFYVCYGSNSGVQMVCPDGTLFNQQLQVCDWWFNVIC